MARARATVTDLSTAHPILRESIPGDWPLCGVLRWEWDQEDGHDMTGSPAAFAEQFATWVDQQRGTHT